MWARTVPYCVQELDLAGQDLRQVWPNLLCGIAALPKLHSLALDDGCSLSGLPPPEVPARCAAAAASGLACLLGLRVLRLSSTAVEPELMDIILRGMHRLSSLQVCAFLDWPLGQLLLLQSSSKR
jgi:hypothetical protein